MNLIQKLIKLKKNRISSRVYYGCVGSLGFIDDDCNNPCVVYALNAKSVKMIQLSNIQRQRYLKHRYGTLKDKGMEDGKMTYIKIINNDVKYYRIPSMRNQILPLLPLGNTTVASLIGEGDVVIDAHQKRASNGVEFSR